MKGTQNLGSTLSRKQPGYQTTFNSEGKKTYREQVKLFSDDALVFMAVEIAKEQARRAKKKPAA